MWTKDFFVKNVILNWNEIAKTKPENYDKKLRGIYRAVMDFSRISVDYKIPIEDEIWVNAEYGWCFYRVGPRNDSGSLIVGPETIRQREHILSSFGISAVKPYKDTVKTIEKSKNVQHANIYLGGVLSETYWWPFLNDAWILGGIHSLIKFYLHTPVSYENKEWLRDGTIWDDKADRPRALGRELIAIHACGYRRVKHKYEGLTGLTFAPTDTSAAINASFKTICKSVKKFNSAKDIQDLLEDAVDYDSYDYASVNPNMLLKFSVLEPIPAYSPDMPDSIHYRFSINDGVIVVKQQLEGKFHRVMTASSVTRYQTNFPTLTQENTRMELLVHQDILGKDSKVVKRMY